MLVQVYRIIALFAIADVCPYCQRSVASGAFWALPVLPNTIKGAQQPNTAEYKCWIHWPVGSVRSTKMLRSAGYKRPGRRWAPTEFVAGVQAPLAPGRRAGDDPAQRPLRRAAPPDQAPVRGGAYRPRSRGAVPDAVSGMSGAQDPSRAARARPLVTPRRPSLALPAFPGSALPLPAPDLGLFPLAASISGLGRRSAGSRTCSISAPSRPASA